MRKWRRELHTWDPSGATREGDGLAEIEGRLGEALQASEEVLDVRDLDQAHPEMDECEYEHVESGLHEAGPSIEDLEEQLRRLEQEMT